MNNLNKAKLNSAAGTLGSLIRAIPLGTATIMLLSSLFVFIGFFLQLIHTFGLKASDWGILNIPAFLFNQLISFNFWMWLLTIIPFPLAAAGLEQEVGTFQFLWLFEILGLITSSIYILVTNMCGIVFHSWPSTQVVGLDIAFFIFVTIEGLHGRGLYEIASRRGIVISREFFFLPWFVFYMVVMLLLIPSSNLNIIPHIAAALVGCMYYLGMLKSCLLSDSIINALETAGMFNWYTQKPSFMIKPGDVQLPMPGSFQSSDGNVRPSFLTQVEQAVRPDQERYVQIGEGSSSFKTERPPDPLLWDETDENDDSSALLKNSK